MEDVTGFIGRVRETERAIEAIQRSANLLVTGRAGIGKSAFLRHVRTRLEGLDVPTVAFVPAGTTKSVLMELARQVHETAGLAVPEALLPPRSLARAKRQGYLPWKDLARSIRRLPVTETVDVIATSLRRRRFLVFLETLEVPPSQADLYGDILEHAQVVAAMDDRNRRTRIDRLMWRFQTRLELKPLPLSDCAEIAERWLAEHPIRFADHATRIRFVRHVARDSGGVPAAVRGMLDAAAKEPEITPAKARSFSHEAGIQYVDMTPLLILLVVVATAARYISRGVGDTEMLVLSGVATALFMGLRFLFWQLRRR